MTLEEVRKGQVNDLQKGVIDELTRGDFLMRNIDFEQIANHVTGGAGWAVTYVTLKEESKTGFRAVNGKYEDTVAKKDTKTAETKIFGGSFSIDRALRDQGGVEKEVEFQMSQKIKAVRKGISHYMINGSIAADGEQFDGLDTILKGSSTDVLAHPTGFDISNYKKIEENAGELESKIREWLKTLSEKPDCLIGNPTLIGKLGTAAIVAGKATQTKDQYGEDVESFGRIPLVEVDTFTSEDGEVLEGVPIDEKGNTALYAVKFGKDGLVFATPSAGDIIDVLAPDFNQAQEQARGLVELRGVPILRKAKSCGVLRNLKVK